MHYLKESIAWDIKAVEEMPIYVCFQLPYGEIRTCILSTDCIRIESFYTAQTWMFMKLQAHVCTHEWKTRKPECLETSHTVSKCMTVKQGGRDSCFPGLDATAVLHPYIT